MSTIIKRVVTQRLENDYEVYIDQEFYTKEYREDFKKHLWSIDTDEELITSLLYQVFKKGLCVGYEGFGNIKTIRDGRLLRQFGRGFKSLEE